MTVKFLDKEEIQAGNLWRFPGGVHPPERKSIANASAIKRMPIPKRLILPFKQHIGQPGIALVAEGDKVVKGQPLTEPGPSAGLVVHAPTSGYIKAIGEYRSAHPSALSVPAFELIPDGLDTWGERHPIKDYSTYSSAELMAHISNAGIAGLGGAGFPTAQKLAAQGQLDYLIINGAECEPYIVSDDRLMREHAAGIIRGTRILLHIAGLQKALIAVEDNKPEAIRALRDACGKDEHLEVRVIPTRYPSGGERQLIQILTGREVPSDGLPMDVGLLMQNVGTAYAIYRAVVFGEPLLERVITVTGEALETPGTVWAMLGTTVEELLQFCGYKSYPKARVIMGGPMMGFTLPALDVPVIKGSNCILAPAKKELPQPGSEMACIRCGACADVCPASLLPQQLYWLARANDFDGLRQHNLADCIECGACAYVCPSEIPLVHYYRQAKAELREQYIEKQKAEVARQRFEARQARLEREKQERLERHQRAAEARKKAQQERQTQSSDDKDPQDPVKAAVARAKAKKAAQHQNTDAGADDKKDKVAAAVARAKAKKEAQAQDTESTDTKKDKVAAAVARAKAKKEAQAQDTESTETKKDKVAAAVAKAKAKKETQANNEQQSSTSNPDDESN